MYIRELSETKQALGGDVTLTIVTSISSEDAKQLFGTLWRQVYVFERQFSRFLPMSELSVFNRSAGLKLPISPEFKALLTTAKTLSIQTGGLYNPFILPALQRAGYIKSAAEGYENDPQEDYSDRQVVTIDHLAIGDSWASIPYGTALDMGGCGKGYLADSLGQTLKKESLKGYWLSLGGDIATFGRDEKGHSLTLAVQDAKTPEGETNWEVHCPVEYSGTATSGTFRRKSQTGGKNWHHIIDATNLKPAISDVRLATVCAGSAVEADVLASCAVILDSKKAPAFLKNHGASAALLQCINEEGIHFEKTFGKLIKKSRSRQLSEVS